MHVTAIPAPTRTIPPLFHWGRVRFTMLFALVIGTMVGLHWKSGWWPAVWRAEAIGLIAMSGFGLFERWPKRLPRWIARWVLQVLAVAVVIPPATAIIFALSTPSGAVPFYKDTDRMAGFSMLCGLGILFGPWTALGALVRQKEALARHQALEFGLQRSELERQALDARLRLLQGQVAPHFLFNTLANVQALVESGSPQAADVLQSLIAYLRAAVPRLNEDATTLGRELELVRAYLELMHMRIPDRLQFALHVDPATLELRCPPMTLLTLVENAVRHGIDPTEEGGRIEVHVRRHGERCQIWVSDTGAGLRQTAGGLGTGLTTLRERLALAFGGDVQLSVGAHAPRGVLAYVEFPAQVGKDG